MTWMPAVEVVEDDAELKLTAELLGIDPQDVDIQMEENVLTIRGERKEEVEREEGKGERKARIWERSYGQFCRSFTLPSSVDADKIVAEFDKGVLAIHLPKTAEAKGHRIEIQAK